MTNNIISSIKAGVCYNQGEYSQFSFFASILHKALKEAFNESAEVERLKELRLSLYEFLNRNFSRISYHNFSLIADCYKSSKEKMFSPLPRICVKACHNGKIIDLVRSDGRVRGSEDRIESNTGFSQVNGTGRYFLCNDIPDSVRSGLYINPRINIECAKKYKKIYNDILEKIHIGNLFKNKYDVEWANCWIDYKQDMSEENFSSFYKSTLIIPMTLWNSNLTDEFIELFGGSDIKIDRMIFGYLCFDNISENYFNDDDIQIGYIFADLMSLYIINMLMYTSYSKTYKSVQRLEDG